MLGAMVVDVLARESAFRVTATARREEWLQEGRQRFPEVRWFRLDAAEADDLRRLDALGDVEWVINCIGITKPFIRDDQADEVERAVRINALWPHRLGVWATERGVKVLQIATDCVYSGTKGGYVETDPHDPLDVYGKTKSLGEAAFPVMLHVRCSIIGPEAQGRKFLLEWSRQQPQAAQVSGYINHRWNGVTTLHFARLCRGLIESGVALPRVQHIVPRDAVTKADLLRCFARYYGRDDIRIADSSAPTAVDRTLATRDPDLNHQLWTACGYARVPTIEDMVAELSDFDFRMVGMPAGRESLR